jgi:hypothetical protein
LLFKAKLCSLPTQHTKFCLNTNMPNYNLSFSRQLLSESDKKFQYSRISIKRKYFIGCFKRVIYNFLKSKKLEIFCLILSTKQFQLMPSQQQNNFTSKNQYTYVHIFHVKALKYLLFESNHVTQYSPFVN